MPNPVRQIQSLLEQALITTTLPLITFRLRCASTLQNALVIPNISLIVS